MEPSIRTNGLTAFLGVHRHVVPPVDKALVSRDGLRRDFLDVLPEDSILPWSTSEVLAALAIVHLVVSFDGFAI